MSSSPTTVDATTLRWRARIVKDAVQPSLQGVGDDSRIHLSVASGEDFSLLVDEEEQYGAKRKKKLHRNWLQLCRIISWWNVWYRVAAVAATLASVFTACDYDKTWYTALQCTCTTTLSALIWYQLERLAILKSIGMRVNKTRHAVNRLSLQRETLTRQLIKAEQKMDLLKNVAYSMKQLTQISQRSVSQIMQTCAEYRIVQKKIERALQQQVQQQILAVVLDSDADGNFLLGPREWSRLRLRLQNMPGITLQGLDRRSTLVDSDDDHDGDDNDDKKENCISVLRVLQVLQEAQQQANRKVIYPGYYNNQDDNDDDDDNGTSVVHLTSQIQLRVDPRALLQGKQQQQQPATRSSNPQQHTATMAPNNNNNHG